MALQKCPDCGHDVSTRAQACPNCGAPMMQPSPADSAKKPVTIERTGKSYKAWTIAGIALITLGFLTCANYGASGGTGTQVGISLIILGGLVGLLAQATGWWQHG